MTDPDTIAAFHALRAAAASDPMGDAVRKHVDETPADDDGIPKIPLDDVPTAPMRLPHDTIPNPFVGDDEAEEEIDQDAVTVIRDIPAYRKALEETDEVARPYDPTHCMM